MFDFCGFYNCVECYVWVLLSVEVYELELIDGGVYYKFFKEGDGS